jgi:hypothetical protein
MPQVLDSVLTFFGPLVRKPLRRIDCMSFVLLSNVGSLTQKAEGSSDQLCRPRCGRGCSRALQIFIRCHSRFRISRMELVYSLPPHIHKGGGSQFVY